MDKLNLTECQSNPDVVDLVKNRVKSFDLEKLLIECGEDFVAHEKAVEAIYCALAAGENVILYGPGGFGKSVLVEALLEKLGIPYSVKVGYKGMQPEELFGVPNMQKLMNNSEYEVAFENSVFTNPGVLVLEEFLDADPSTGAALKDIISHKGFRDKNGFKHSMISNVIICANKSPEDVSSNDSLAAFFKERFPIRHHMAWTSFTQRNYLDFFRVFFKKDYHNNKAQFKVLADLCAYSTAIGDTIVSPRVASQAGKIMLETGIRNIKVVAGINTDNLESLLENGKIQNKQNIQKRVLGHVGKEIDETYKMDYQGYLRLAFYEKKLQELEFDDEYLFTLETILGKIDKIKSDYYESQSSVETIQQINDFEEICSAME